MDEINSYQDVLSFKTAPKSVIIEKFLESEGEKKHIEEEKKEDSKKNSSALRNAYHTACLNNSKTELQEQADKICDSIFNGIERAKELGI
jgi:cytidylate kinase